MRYSIRLALFIVISAGLFTSESSAGWFFNREKKSQCDNGQCAISNLPPGGRQVCKHNKLWPPRPRPRVPMQPYWEQYHSAHYWPAPYKAQDEALVLDALETQHANGWKVMTTLYDYHFDQETNALNSAGQIQLDWILQNAPAQYRSAYVQSSRAPEVSDARLGSVQSEVMNQTGQLDSLPVMLRFTTPLGRPAHEVQSINSLRKQNMPSPSITYSAATASDE